MSKKLWGGRFKKKIDKEFEEFSKSIQYDYKLARVDVFHSIIHTIALSGSKLLKDSERKKIISALGGIIKEIDTEKFKPNLSSEDIHTDIHNRLEKKIGKLAAKVHTLRSRNDQIAFNEKFYCLNEAISIRELIGSALNSFLFLMKKFKNQAFVGYTHTQRAQVILFSDYLGAFGHMLLRDDRRLKDFYDSLIPYIGAGALAGTSLDKKEYFKAIDDFSSFDKSGSGKIRSVESSMDSVSDRDFLIEFLNILCIVQMHLSRFAEDMILYSTQEFNYVDLPEEFCTGSSLMPHKKNPDFLELVRGYTGRIYANHAAILTMMKGLPLTYNRDMQLDKEPLFSSLDIIKSELKIIARFLKGIKLNTKVIEEALADEQLYATELAEFLVFKGVSFADAHNIVGKLVRYAQDKKIHIKSMPDKLLKSFSAKLSQKDVRKIMRAGHAIKSKKSIKRKALKLNA